jgi:hypothetical protein
MTRATGPSLLKDIDSAPAYAPAATSQLPYMDPSTGFAYPGTAKTVINACLGITQGAGKLAYSDGTAIALSSAGTLGQVWTVGASGVPTAVDASTLVGTATKSTNLAGGLIGQIPYQSALDTTAFLAAGTSGQFFKSNGAAAPSWVTLTKTDVGLANVENTALSTWAGSTNVTTIGTLSGLTVNGGTVTTSTPFFNFSQTWNAGAVTFTGGVIDITDTASASISKILDIRIGGVTKAYFFKTATGVYSWGTPGSSGGFICGVGGSGGSALINNAIELGGTCVLAWVGGAPGQGNTQTLQIAYDAADTWAQRRGTNAQAKRLYNTYTDASNWERLDIKWATNVCTIETAALGTGTLRGLKIGGASTSLLGLWGATPIVQPTTSVASATIVNGAGTASKQDDTYDGYTLAKVVKALRQSGILA